MAAEDRSRRQNVWSTSSGRRPGEHDVLRDAAMALAEDAAVALERIGGSANRQLIAAVWASGTSIRLTLTGAGTMKRGSLPSRLADMQRTVASAADRLRHCTGGARERNRQAWPRGTRKRAYCAECGIPEYARPMVVLCSSRVAGAVNAACDHHRPAPRKPHSINTAQGRDCDGGTMILASDR